MENVKQDASIGTNILRVSASDEDADNNGAIVYSLTAPFNPNDLEYFEIQPESGWIVLKKPLDVSVCFPLFNPPSAPCLILIPFLCLRTQLTKSYDFHLKAKKKKQKRYTNICLFSDFLLTIKRKKNSKPGI